MKKKTMCDNVVDYEIMLENVAMMLLFFFFEGCNTTMSFIYYSDDGKIVWRENPFTHRAVL